MDQGRYKSNNNFNNSFSHTPQDERNASPLPQKDVINTSFGEDASGMYKSVKKYTIGKLFSKTTSQKDLQSPRSDGGLPKFSGQLPQEQDEIKRMLLEKDQQILNLQEKLKIHESQSGDQQRFATSQKSALQTIKKTFQDKITKLNSDLVTQNQTILELQDQIHMMEQFNKDSLNDSIQSTKIQEKDQEINRLTALKSELEQTLMNVQKDLVAYSKEKQPMQNEIARLTLLAEERGKYIKNLAQDIQQQSTNQQKALKLELLKKIQAAMNSFLAKDDYTQHLTEFTQLRDSIEACTDEQVSSNEGSSPRKQHQLIVKLQQLIEIMTQQKQQLETQLIFVRQEQFSCKQEFEQQKRQLNMSVSQAQLEIQQLQHQILTERQNLERQVHHEKTLSLISQKEQDETANENQQALMEQIAINEDLQKQVFDLRQALQDQEMTMSAQQMQAMSQEQINHNLAKENKELQSNVQQQMLQIQSLNNKVASQTEQISTISQKKIQSQTHFRLSSQQYQCNTERSPLTKTLSTQSRSLQRQKEELHQKNLEEQQKLKQESEEIMLKKLRKDMQIFNIVIGMLFLVVCLAFTYTVYKNYEASINLIYSPWAHSSSLLPMDNYDQ